MSETSTATPKAGVIVGAGGPERGDFSNQKQTQAATEEITTTTVAKEKAEEASAGESGKTEVAKQVELPELSEEQLKELFAKKGIEGFDGNFDTLKQKLEKAERPADTQPTDEEKKLAESALEKRMLDYHIANGGTPEQFVALKQIAAIDLKELSVAEIKKEMKENGFNEDEINHILKERYYQLNPEEEIGLLDQKDDETDVDFEARKKNQEEFLKKKVSYGSKKLESRSTHTKQNAEGILNNLREAIKAEDNAKQKETEWLSKVDDYSKKAPRTVTLELGKLNEAKLDPVQYDVTEADIAEVVDTLKDSSKRQQYFFNEDNSLNLSKIGDLMLRNKILESAVKAGFIEGGNRQVAIFQKTFPGSAHALGVGGSQAQPAKRKGVIASAGQPEVSRLTT